MIKNFEELLKKAKEKKGIVVGVPAPEDLSSINTIIKSKITTGFLILIFSRELGFNI